MSRRKKTAPTAEALLQMKSLAGTYGRGGAVIAAAWVDDALEEYLRRFLSRDPQMANYLLQPEGALGTFGVRIKLAYALGMISDEVRRDLDVIRLVRNDFAHLRDASGFENPSVIQRCRSLRAYRCYASSVRNAGRTPRQRFMVSALLLAAAIIDVTDAVSPTSAPDEKLVDGAVRKLAAMPAFRSVIQPYRAAYP
jgi:DNA-binding MltR family transcriptional regulator